MIKEKIVKRTISDFLNVEYLRFSLYTVAERAIPSICDGFKPGARKIVHAACTGTLKSGKTNKMITLVGNTMEISQYAHGEKDKETAIADFKTNVSDQLGVEAE